MKTRKRIGDKIVTTVETPAEIEYDDVLAGCSVETDDESRAPWEDCDGWQHHLDGPPSESVQESQNGIIRHNRDYRGQLVVLDCESDLPDYVYFHDRGASKQVARQLAAIAKRRTINQLVKWYEDGWEWYGAVCKYEADDGTEYHNSCWGIDDYDYADEMSRIDCLGEVIHEMEQAGYTVVNQPDWKVLRRKAYLDGRRTILMYNLNSQNTEKR